MTTTFQATQRTARLLDEQFFAGAADRREIAAGLSEFSVLIAADKSNVESRNGQQLIIVTSLLLARMGVNVALDMPEAQLYGVHPPLRGDRLKQGLVELGGDLIPGVLIRDGNPQTRPIAELCIGDSPSANASTHALRVGASDWTMEIEDAHASHGATVSGTMPFGSCAGAASAAAEVLRVLLPALAERISVSLSADAHRLEVGGKIRLDLRDYFPEFEATGLDLKDFDAISGGAINSSAVYVLECCSTTGDVRVFEDDILEMSNLNRYFFSRASEMGIDKIDHLAAAGIPALRVTGQKLRYDQAAAARFSPLAEKVIVGVDHIPSRWLVAEHSPNWLGVGSTQALTALVSSHRPQEACARCQHPVPLEDDGEVATISFVSFWAGLLLAMELLSFADGHPSSAQTLYCQPFGFDGPLLMRTPLAAREDCPNPRCAGYSALRSAA